MKEKVFCLLLMILLLVFGACNQPANDTGDVDNPLESASDLPTEIGDDPQPVEPDASMEIPSSSTSSSSSSSEASSPISSSEPATTPPPLMIPINAQSVYITGPGTLSLSDINSGNVTTSVVLHNESSYTISYVPRFSLERLDGDAWVEMSYSDNKPNWNSVTLQMKSGETGELEDFYYIATVWVYANDPVPGSYRICKGIYTDSDDLIIYHNFDILQ